MGAKVSLPQAVYEAVRGNNLALLRTLVEQASSSSGGAPPAQQLLQWQDAEGRSALHVAAARNLMRHAEVLLAAGADVSLNTSSRAQGGTPLHEAVAAKHELMADMLLNRGANPFVVNASGRTAYDVAVEARHLVLIRRLEQAAIFACYASFKVLALKGFASAAKDRWCVVVPRYLMPQPGERVITVRVMLWLYRDAGSAEPRTKLWLDGAAVHHRAPDAREATLRLHPQHEQPANVYCKYAQGWTLNFSPASGGGDAAAATQQFLHLVAACASPLAPRPAAAAAAAAPAAAAVGGAAYPPVAAPAAAPDSAPSWASVPLAAAPAPPTPTPPPAAAAPSPWLALDGGRPPATYSDGAEGWQALPGETDEAFARRLSERFHNHEAAATPAASQAGGGQYPRVPSPAAQGDAADEQQQQQQQQQQQRAGAAPPSGRSASADGPSAPPAPAGALGLSAAPAAAGAAASATADGEDMCVICLVEEREVGLLHGNSVHKCVCKECAAMLRVDQPCPVCRQRIERMLAMY